MSVGVSDERLKPKDDESTLFTYSVCHTLDVQITVCLFASE
jgi:hypothetical protein